MDKYERMKKVEEHQEQSISLWERLSLFSRTQSKEEQRENRRWIAIYSLYKLTRWQWQAIFERQQGCCAICGISQDVRNPVKSHTLTGAWRTVGREKTLVKDIVHHVCDMVRFPRNFL